MTSSPTTQCPKAQKKKNVMSDSEERANVVSSQDWGTKSPAIRKNTRTQEKTYLYESTSAIRLRASTSGVQRINEHNCFGTACKRT